jgi:hypothetical protein
VAGSGKEHNRKPERAHRERSGCSAFKRTAPAKAGGRDRSGGNRLAVALIVEEGEPVRENTYGSSAYSIPRNRIADLRRAAFFLSFFGAIATIGAWAMGPALRS